MKSKILSMLSEEDFISGEVLAKELGVSRTAVWKQVNSLKKKGYEIESTQNKGYHLVSRPELPIAEEVTRNLDTTIIGREIVFFNEIDSTNKHAKELVKKEVDEGFVVVADVQTSGRGRKNRQWSSSTGGLWFSIILYPTNLPPQRGMLITMAVSISVAQAISKITDITPVIKWPNDLLIDNKKVCGILTELDAEMDNMNHCVVGVGINVNNELESDLTSIATNLKDHTESKISRINLLQSILENFDEYYGKIKSGDHSFIRNSWFEHADIIGKKVRVIGEKETIEGAVSGVDVDGSLLIKTSEGVIRIVSGDIEYIE